MELMCANLSTISVEKHDLGPKDYLFLIKILVYSYFYPIVIVLTIVPNTDIEWRLTLINKEVLQGVALTLHLRCVDPYQYSKFEYLVGINT